MKIQKNKQQIKINGNNYGKIAKGDIIEQNNIENSLTFRVNAEGDMNLFLGKVDINGVANGNLLLNFNNKEKDNFSEEYKEYVKKFEKLECYLINVIFKNGLNNIDLENNYLIFGKLLLDWIMGRIEFPIKEYKKFYLTLQKDYNITKDSILFKRWEALEQYFSSNIIGAVKIYKDILEHIEDLDSSKTIIDDFLIDGRNILNEMEQLNNRVLIDNPFQTEINKHKRKLVSPIYDRIKTDVYEKVLKDSFEMETKNKNTVIFGSALNSILNEIQYLIYNTILYGSITHLKLCREVIANVMYSYSKIYNEKSFYKITLKMLVLSCNFKQYKKMCDYLENKYDFWYEKEFIDEIKSIEEKMLSYKKINYKNFIYGFYGKFLSDSEYSEIEKTLFDYLIIIENNDINLIEEILKSIETNINRANARDILNIFEIFIKKEWKRFYFSIGSILNSLEIKELPLQQYRKYVKIVRKISKEDKNVNLNNSIAKILSRNRMDIRFFKYKKNVVIKDLIYMKTKMNDNQKFFEKMLEDYRKIYEKKEENPKTIYRGDVSYQLSTKYFEIVKSNKEFMEVFKEDYIVLVSKILQSINQTNLFKLEQLKNLLYISVIKEYNFLNDKVLKALENMQFGRGDENCFVGWLNYEEINNDEIEFVKKLIQTILQEKSKVYDLLIEGIEKYYDNAISIDTIMECIKVIVIAKSNNVEILSVIYLFVISNLNNSLKRNQIIKLFGVFKNTIFEEKIVKKMEDISKNCTYSVAREMINLAAIFGNENIIAKILEKNNNYNIRALIKKEYEKSIKKK